MSRIFCVVLAYEKLNDLREALAVEKRRTKKLKINHKEAKKRLQLKESYPFRNDGLIDSLKDLIRDQEEIIKIKIAKCQLYEKQLKTLEDQIGNFLLDAVFNG